jgi:hypothetical protein
MKSTKAPIDTIDAYLVRVKEKLWGVPSVQVSEILAELRSHILDSVGTPNVAASPNAVEDTIERLGPPEALAKGCWCAVKRRWSTAGESPARELVRSTRKQSERRRR